jgi:hypothetical protein
VPADLLFALATRLGAAAADFYRAFGIAVLLKVLAEDLFDGTISGVLGHISPILAPVLAKNAVLPGHVRARVGQVVLVANAFRPSFASW